MKKTYVIMFAAGLMGLAASCAKEEKETNQAVETQPAVTILASLEGDGTKVTVSNSTGKVEWAAGDQIAVCAAGSYVESDGLAASGNPGSFTFGSLDDAQRDNFAVYPASAAVSGSVTADNLKVRYADAYALTDLGSEQAAPVMIAVNAPASNLAFKHVGSLVRITVNDVPKGVDELKVIFDKDVTGEFSVDGAGTDAPAVSAAAATTKNVVSFTFSALAAMQNVVLSIPVPTGAFASVRVEAYAGGLPFPCGITVSGATLGRRGAKKLTADMPVFSVSGTKKVVFSPGNLQAYATGYGASWTWQFAENQYDLLASNATVDGKMHIAEETGVRDIFRWSTAKAADFGINAEEASTDTYYDYVNDTFLDWGANEISGYPANTWRTPGANLNYKFAALPADIADLEGRGEWEYLFEERAASTITGLTGVGGSDQEVENARYVKSMVCGVRAYVLFPDHFVYPADVNKAPLINRGDAWWRAVYDVSAWEKMEAAGAVCLPCVNGSIYYYTSSWNAGDASGWGVNMLNLHYDYGRIGWGRPYQNYNVRLVRDAN